MEFKQFGKDGPRISAIGMGTYYDPLWILTGYLGWRRSATEKLGALKAGLELGMNLIDTAEVYRSEEIVGRAIRGMQRETLFIATKVMSNHLKADSVTKSLESSLRRLGTSYVDLYQIHWPSQTVPIAETLGAMEKLAELGKIRYIGVSNFSLKQMVEARAALKKLDLASIQMSYNLLDRKIEEDIIPYCRKEGLSILAYFPLAHGKLTKSEALLKVAEAHGKTSSQVALNWLADKDSVFPIPRASTAAHVRENAGSVGWQLSEAEKVYLESLRPPKVSPPVR
jgi:diketogulonate reductase-like aldo/keto reductase